MRSHSRGGERVRVRGGSGERERFLVLICKGSSRLRTYRSTTKLRLKRAPPLSSKASKKKGREKKKVKQDGRRKRPQQRRRATLGQGGRSTRPAPTSPSLRRLHSSSAHPHVAYSEPHVNRHKEGTRHICTYVFPHNSIRLWPVAERAREMCGERGLF